jgi:replication factor C small subunit
MLIVDKYKPTIENIILNPSIKKVIEDQLKDPWNKLKNMTLAGIPGIGKTALALAIVNYLNAECLFLNASQENNVDTIRNKVSDFCGSVSLEDQIKIVVLDEADCLSVGKAGAAGAQEVLRGLIEAHQDDCRFILTCNYVNRLIPALISRCPILNIQFTPELVLERVTEILKEENVKCKKRDLEDFFEVVIKSQFPKVRNIFHALDTCITSDHKFDISNLDSCKTNNNEVEKFAEELKKLIGKKKPRDIRQYYIDNADIFDKDYQLLANALFNTFEENPILQISIADYIFKMVHVVDPEIQFYAMILSLSEEH